MRPILNCTQLVVFDLDGTLVNTPEWIVAFANESRRELGFKARLESDLMQLVGKPPQTFWSDISNLTEADSERLTIVYRSKIDRHPFDSNSLYKGTKEILKLLANYSLTLAVASNKPSKNSRLILEKCGVVNFFSLIVGSDSCKPKPSTEMLETLATKFAITNSNIAMIGDRVDDMVSAVRFGAKSIGLTQTVETKRSLKLAGAHFVYKDINELYQALIGG